MSKNPLIDSMVDDFLRWPLPDSVCADGCATKQGPGRVGTNLLTAIEAKAMFEAVVLPKIQETELREASAHIIALWDQKDGHLTSHFNRQGKAAIEMLRAALEKPQRAHDHAQFEAWLASGTKTPELSYVWHAAVAYGRRTPKDSILCPTTPSTP